MGSRDLRRIYAIDAKKWTVLEEREAPGIPWAAVSTKGTLRFTIGEGPNDDRYIRRFIPDVGFPEEDRFACPEFTGSYLSYDGKHLYLSQWYKHRILKLDESSDIMRIIEIGAEICGHVFVDGSITSCAGPNRMAKAGRSHNSIRERKSPTLKISLSFRSRVAHLLSTAKFFGRTTARRTQSSHLSFRIE